ncbi:MAG: inorganic diphosphatase [Bacteroidales bacterium]|nr:inorganic diphosphatase [Bacteroidales bacterium]
MKSIKHITYLILFLAIAGCTQESKIKDYDSLPLYSENGNVNAVIEIPAGTNHKIEYDKKDHEFKVDQKNGKDRIVAYLPYLGNYGFLPSTYMDPAIGGDGDALDVLVIGESCPTASLVEIIPIGVLFLEDGGEIDTKIIAIPVKEKDRIINVEYFNELKEKYPKIDEIILNWFLNYKGKGIMKFVGWGDRSEADAEIRKWKKGSKAFGE